MRTKLAQLRSHSVSKDGRDPKAIASEDEIEPAWHETGAEIRNTAIEDERDTADNGATNPVLSGAQSVFTGGLS